MERTTFRASDGKDIAVYEMAPATPPGVVVHLSHGMGEHAQRYEWVMQHMTAAGYHVIAHDHRAHGHTADVLGDFGPDGVNAALRDMSEIIKASAERFPGAQIVLLGHSMGAMFAQMFASRFGEQIDALILSGTPSASAPFTAWLFHTIARFERWRTGGHKDSALLQFLMFGGANAEYKDEPGATGFEWLSRDKNEVQKYVDDPMCGFVPCPASVCDLFAAERANWKPEALRRIPADLPVYLFAGTADPVNDNLNNIKRLLAHYRDHNITVSTRFYEGGRHELFNETNRDEVIADVLAWINEQTNTAAPD